MYCYEGTVTVHDSCVGGEVHRVRGLGHVTSLDLRASHTSLIVGVASSITYLPPGEFPILYFITGVCCGWPKLCVLFASK